MRSLRKARALCEMARRPMLFNSVDFLVFLLVVLVVFHGVAASWEPRKWVLLAASWFFYASWSPRFLLLLIATTWVDFHLARWIHAARGSARARVLLIASLVINLGALGFFK